MRVRSEEWQRELSSHDELFGKLGAKRPAALQTERERLGARRAVARHRRTPQEEGRPPALFRVC